MMRQLIAILAFSAFAVSCTQAAPTASTPRPEAPLSSKLYLAKECDESTRREDRVTLVSADLSKTSGKSQLCVDLNAKLLLDAEKIHIKPKAADEIYVEIPCQSAEGLSKSLQALPTAGRLVLVAENKAINTFSYLDKRDLMRKCVVFPKSDLEESISFCESVRGALKKSTEECTRFCDAKKESVIPDVCVVGNATFD